MKNEISAFVIVKDAISTIKECLDSLAPIATEIVVVDTGSMDGTKELLDNYEPPTEFANSISYKLYFHPWVDDFSLVRNFAISKCTCPWIFFLDSDEILSVEGCDIIEQLRSDNFCGKEAFWIENSSEFYYAPRLELFKNDEKYRFKGAVHEYLDIETIPEDKIGNLSFYIEHRKQEKDIWESAKKYFNIFETSLKEGKLNSIRDFYFYGANALMAKEYEKAKPAFEIVINLHKIKPTRLVSDVINSYDNLAMFYQNNNDIIKAIEIWIESTKVFPRFDIYYFIAEAFRYMNRIPEARSYLINAEALATEQTKPQNMFFVSKHVKTYFIPLLKAKLFYDEGEYQQAMDVLSTITYSVNNEAKELWDLCIEETKKK